MQIAETSPVRSIRDVSSEISLRSLRSSQRRLWVDIPKIALYIERCRYICSLQWDSRWPSGHIKSDKNELYRASEAVPSKETQSWSWDNLITNEKRFHGSLTTRYLKKILHKYTFIRNYDIFLNTHRIGGSLAATNFVQVFPSKSLRQRLVSF